MCGISNQEMELKKKEKKRKVGRDGALLRNVLTVLLEMDAAGRIPADVS